MHAAYYKQTASEILRIKLFTLFCGVSGPFFSVAHKQWLAFKNVNLSIFVRSVVAPLAPNEPFSVTLVSLEVQQAGNRNETGY